MGRKGRRSRKVAKCNCRKTACNNKYCDCLAAGQRCGEECSCVNCGNEQ